MELTDGVIILRPFRPKDAEAHLAGEDVEQIKWLSGGKGTLDGVRTWIKKNQINWQNNGPIFNFAIWDKTCRSLVGMVEANTDYQSIEGISQGDTNISYGLYPNSRGKGYASRAVKLVADFLKTKRIKRSVIRVNPKNEASVKTARRLGYEKVNQITTKKHETLDIYVKNLI